MKNSELLAKYELHPCGWVFEGRAYITEVRGGGNRNRSFLPYRARHEATMDILQPEYARALVLAADLTERIWKAWNK